MPERDRQWLEFEQYRRMVAIGWPDSDYKTTTLKAIEESIKNLQVFKFVTS